MSPTPILSQHMFRTFFRSHASGPHAADPQLVAALREARERAAADADLALTAERADAQRAAILRRLGADADPRVLSFPPRAVLGLSGPELADAEEVLAPRRPQSSPRPALGWILTAAAAGIVVGVGTGHGIYDELPGAAVPTAPRHAAVAPVTMTPATADADDSILAEVEVALAGRGVEELQPLDALTPTVSIIAAAGR